MEQSGSSFIVYKSSAGSGKTYTLVKEYLKIVLQNPDKIRNVLGITFTNAAAAEMKSRIILALADIIFLSGKKAADYNKKTAHLLRILSDETGLSHSDIIHRSKLTLSRILHNYSDFSISTIDSFVHRVIRSFAFDLHLPMNFEVEVDAHQLLQQAVELLINKVGTDKKLTDLLVRFIEQRADDNQNHVIENEILKLAYTLLDDPGEANIKKLSVFDLDDFSNYNQRLKKNIEDFESEISQWAQKAIQIIQENGVEIQSFFYGKTGIGAYFNNLANGLVLDKIQPNSYVIKTIEEDKWTSGKATVTEKQSIAGISDQLKDIFFAIQKVAMEKLETCRVSVLLRQNLFPLAVLSEIDKILRDIKSEKSILHISDFNKKISEIVSVESAPFIYERIGERYQHYMIDEFQDTSALQWQNLLPLVENSLASGNTNLVVGDGKQAIYRWRNGEVEQFSMLPNIPQYITAQNREQWQEVLQRYYVNNQLQTNYRSAAEIVNFNNSFFNFAQKLLPQNLLEIYNNQEQYKKEDAAGGYVQIEFVNEEVNSETWKENTKKRIYETIQELVKKGHPIKDITVLCRSNADASSVASYLLERKIDVISSESLLLSNSSKVSFIISVIRILANSKDMPAVVEFIQFLIKNGYIEKDLHNQLNQIIQYRRNARNDHTFLNYLGDYVQKRNIPFSFTNCASLNLYEVSEYIVRVFFAKDKADPFIIFFLDAVQDYLQKNASSVYDFLDWWDINNSKLSVVVPEGVDAVQVMTIHKSKGLQFNVVIVPMVEWDFYKRLGKEGTWIDLEGYPDFHPLSTAWIRYSKALENTPWEEDYENEKNKSLLDNINISYVAFTRAVDKLFIMGKMSKSGKFTKNNVNGLIHDYLMQSGYWEESKLLYSFGQFHKNEDNRKDTPPDEKDKNNRPVPETLYITLNSLISERWDSRLSLTTNGAELVGNTGISGQYRGTIFHKILQKIETIDDLPAVLKAFELSGVIPSNGNGEIEKKLSNILEHEKVKPCYAERMQFRNECGMFNHEGKHIRADRVVFEEEKTTVLEYKTGEMNNDHLLQLKEYLLIAKENQPEKKVSGLLVYIDTGEVFETII